MATATELMACAADLMVSRAGRNSYTQGAKRKYFFGYPDNEPGSTVQKGYSDCSSAVRAAILAASGIDIGSNTSAQINNRSKKGRVVHTTDGCYPDEASLLPGDCLYFKGNSSHPLDVGHVEMYIGDGKICGHGSGAGPKVRSMQDYCKSRANAKKRYFMAVRWIPEEDESTPQKVGGVTIASGSWHVRTGPGEEYASAGVVHGGDVLQKVDAGSWIPVLYGGRLCFIGPKAAGK